MLYIIGVYHPQQFGCGCGDEHSQNEFKDFLNKLVPMNNIKAIAEEASKDSPIEGCGSGCDGNIGQTIPMRVAVEHSLKHIFADPDRDERLKLGINKSRQNIAIELGIFKKDENYSKEEQSKINLSMRPYDKLREEEWLERILPAININTVFICGHGHVGYFSDLLRERGVDYKLLKF